MSVQEVVQIVQSYLEHGQAALERRYGLEAASAAQDLVALLRTRLEESIYASLWDQFEAAPRQTAGELVGALEALIEADPALFRRMEAFLDVCNRIVPSAASEVEGADAKQQRGDAYQSVDSPGGYSEAGTYLYGNLRPGAGSESEAVEMEVLSQDGFDAEMAAPDVSQVVALFQDLYEFVEGQTDIAPPEKQRLWAELEQLATDVAGGEEEYEEFIANHLCTLEQIDPRVYRLVIQKLAGSEADFAPVAQRVARRMLDVPSQA